MTGPVTLDAIRGTAGEESAPLGSLLAQIALAGRTIAHELSRAALVGQLGTTGDINVQGETVKKLDVWANDVMVSALGESGVVCTMVSEEMADPLHLESRCAGARYVVCFDPVDGSSNLDVNGIVGSIFSVRRRTPGMDHVKVDAVQPGTAQIAAGYVMYGPSTVMVLTTGDGVHGFTLDPSDGRFILSHRAVRIPARGHIYSVNEANTEKWQPGVREFIQHLRVRTPERTFTARYVGSLVADFHRTLLDGGIFLYPGEKRGPGKLRLQYEAAPMAFIAEQAGGKATTGHERILGITPTAYHQRVPLVVGSADDVSLAEEFMTGRR